MASRSADDSFTLEPIVGLRAPICAIHQYRQKTVLARNLAPGCHMKIEYPVVRIHHRPAMDRDADRWWCFLSWTRIV